MGWIAIEFPARNGPMATGFVRGARSSENSMGNLSRSASRRMSSTALYLKYRAMNNPFSDLRGERPQLTFEKIGVRMTADLRIGYVKCRAQVSDFRVGRGVVTAAIDNRFKFQERAQ